MYVQQSTTITIRIGPMINNLDGSANTTATLTVRVSKNGGAFAARSDATAITHDSDGYYLVTLDATDTNTIGRLDISATATGCQTVRIPIFVLASQVFGWLTGTGTPTTTTSAIGSIAANGITAASIATGAITNAKFAAGAIDAASIASNAITNAKLAAGAISSATFAAGAINSAAIATGGITSAAFAAGAIDASAFAQAAADRAWASGTRTLTSGSGIVLAKGVGITGFNDPTAASVASAVWSEAIPGSYGAGTAGARLNSASSGGDPWSTLLPGAYAAGTAGAILGNGLAGGTVVVGSISAGAITDSAIAAGAITASKIGADAITNSAIASGAISASKFASGAIDGVSFAQTAADLVWTSLTRTLTSGANITLAKGTGITGLTDIDQQGVRDALGANLTPSLGSMVNTIYTWSEDTPTLDEAAAAHADKLLGRSIAGAADGGRTVRQALQVLRNRVERPATAGTGTVYAEDDTTVSWTFTVTTSGSAQTITGFDPA